MTPASSEGSDEPKRAPSQNSWALVGIFWLLAISVLTIAQGRIVRIVTAMLLALIFSPVRRVLGRMGLSSGVSAAIILLTLLGTMGSIGYLISGAVEESLAEAPHMIVDVGDKLKELTGTVQPVMDTSEQIQYMATKEPRRTRWPSVSRDSWQGLLTACR